MRLLKQACFTATLGNSSCGGNLNMMTAAAGVPPSPSPERVVTGACTSSSSRNGYGSKDNVIVRTARLNEAKHLTAIINEAFQASAFFKKDSCTDRVTADGKEGAISVVIVHAYCMIPRSTQMCCVTPQQFARVAPAWRYMGGCSFLCYIRTLCRLRRSHQGISIKSSSAQR